MKGLRTLDTGTADIVPTFVPARHQDDERPSTAFRPSKQPVKGSTELTRDERHTAHLRKKRQQKNAKKAADTRLEIMAKFDEKTRKRVEKGKVMQTLAENRNVTIVGHTGSAQKGRKTALEAGEKGRPGKKWKHDLTRTLTQDRNTKK